MKCLPAFGLATLFAFGGLVAADHASAAAKDVVVRKHNRTVALRVRRATVIVFAPPRWVADAKANEGTSEMVAHVSFAVGDVKQCKGTTPIDVRMVFADRLVLDIDGRRDDIDLSSRFPDSAGAYLLRPGKKMCAIATPKDTASLGDLLSQAVGKFFDVPACLRPGMSDPCNGGG